jgi:putative copper resistance protein D
LTLEAGLVAFRFLHYAALMVLFGVSLFPLYAYPSHFGDLPARLDRWLQLTLTTATFVALLSGIFCLLFTVANMTDTLSGAFEWNELWSVLSETGFGEVWVARLALIALLLGVAGIRMVSVTRHPDRLTLVLCAGVLASLAGVGHTRVNEGIARLIHMGADGAHLLAAGAWLGGLVALAYILAMACRPSSPDHSLDASNVLLRFSGMGYVAVAVLIGSGLLNSWFLVGSFANLARTPYGQLLLVKLCLFAGMLALAALNRYWLLPSLLKENAIGQPAAWLIRLRHHILGEQALGLFVILIVSVLGTMQPAISSSSQ